MISWTCDRCQLNDPQLFRFDAQIARYQPIQHPHRLVDEVGFGKIFDFAACERKELRPQIVSISIALNQTPNDCWNLIHCRQRHVVDDTSALKHVPSHLWPFQLISFDAVADEGLLDGVHPFICADSPFVFLETDSGWDVSTSPGLKVKPTENGWRV